VFARPPRLPAAGFASATQNPKTFPRVFLSQTADRLPCIEASCMPCDRKKVKPLSLEGAWEKTNPAHWVVNRFPPLGTASFRPPPGDLQRRTGVSPQVAWIRSNSATRSFNSLRSARHRRSLRNRPNREADSPVRRLSDHSDSVGVVSHQDPWIRSNSCSRSRLINSSCRSRLFSNHCCRFCR